MCGERGGGGGGMGRTLDPTRTRHGRKKTTGSGVTAVPYLHWPTAQPGK